MTTPLRIRLPYQTEEEFLSRYGDHLSHEGLFVATRFPQPQGTAVVFEVVLAQGECLLPGEALVARTESGLSRGERGMTLTFTQLDDASMAWLEKVLGPPVATGRKAPLPLDKDEPVLGVDLGTQACRASTWRENRCIDFAPVPSCMWLGPQGHWLAGAEAQEAFGKEPEAGLAEVKRLLLEPLSEHTPREDGPLPLGVEALTGVGISLRNQLFTPVEILAVLLKAVVEKAEAQAGCIFRHVVLTVPTAFNDCQRAALWEAARHAGLTVLCLLNDSSAAAVAYAEGRRLARKRLLVADLGKRNLSVAVIQVTGDEWEVLSAGGRKNLGGAALDQAVLAALKRFVPHGPRVGTLAHLESLAQEAREALSSAPSARVTLPWNARGPEDSSLAFQLTVERPDVERATQSLCQAIVDTLEQALRAAGIHPHTLDECLFVGQAWAWPQLQEALAQRLELPSLPSPRSEPLVARGAALWGRALTLRASGRSALRLSEVLGTPVFVTSPSGERVAALVKNVRLPAEVALAQEEGSGQGREVAVFQGDQADDFLGTITPTPGRWLLSMDENGLLSASAHDEVGRPRQLGRSRPTWPQTPADGFASLPPSALALPAPKGRFWRFWRGGR